MNNLIKFFVVFYLISALGVWALFSKNTGINAGLARELAETENLLAIEQSTNETLNKKIGDARANANFLSLALCPTIETSKDTLCVKNSAEWLSQTIQAGNTLANHDIKTKIEMLLASLGNKKKPTAKEFYELLKPIEISSLRALTESLK